MDNLQARLNLAADLERIRDVILARGWSIAPWPLEQPEFVVEMVSGIDRETYAIHILASGYPDEPPSIRCVIRGTTNAANPTAWPRCDGFRPPPQADLCIPICKEGFATHPEWKNTSEAWRPTGNPIWLVLSTIQNLFNDSKRYHGRHP